MNELKLDTRTVALLLLAWLIFNKRDSLRIVAQGIGAPLRGGGRKPQAWQSEAAG